MSSWNAPTTFTLDLSIITGVSTDFSTSSNNSLELANVMAHQTGPTHRTQVSKTQSSIQIKHLRGNQ